MADLDRELLQLAGDDSSDDEQPQEIMVTTKTESASPPVPQVSDPVNGTSSTSNTTPKAGGKRPVNRGKGDESEEEGEA